MSFNYLTLPPWNKHSYTSVSYTHLIMEWTKSDKIHTAFPQSDKLGYHIYNLCGIQYPVYGGSVSYTHLDVYKRQENRYIY